MKCRICPREITPERQQCWPRTVTCGQKCSIEHTKRSRVASALRSVRRKRALIEGTRQA